MCPATWSTAVFLQERSTACLSSKAAITADKVDIFRVNVDTPAEDIYNVTTEELKNSQVSPEVMAAFDERHAVLRSCKKTAGDHVAGHTAPT